MVADDGFKLGGQLPVHDQLAAGLAMVPAKELALGVEDAGGGTAVSAQREAVLFGPDHGQRQSPDVVDDAGGVGDVSVHEAYGGQLIGDQGTGQVVAPDGAHGGLVERFAHVPAHAYGQAEALQVIGAHHRDGLQDAAGGKARRIQERVRDREHFAGEGRIGGD